MASIEETLMQELRFGGLADDNLKELVGIVAGIQKGGLKAIKVLPKGIPPLVDSVRVSGILDAGNISDFLTNVVRQTPRLGEVIFFPYGIPLPDIFRVTVDIGNPVQGPIGSSGGL